MLAFTAGSQGWAAVEGARTSGADLLLQTGAPARAAVRGIEPQVHAMGRVAAAAERERSCTALGAPAS